MLRAFLKVRKEAKIPHQNIYFLFKPFYIYLTMRFLTTYKVVALVRRQRPNHSFLIKSHCSEAINQVIQELTVYLSNVITQLVFRTATLDTIKV